MSNSSLNRRLIQGLGVNTLSQIVNAAIQIITLPLMLYFWGVEKYGEWLLIMSLPVYLTLSDFGLGSAVGTEMALRTSRRDYIGANAVFLTTFLLFVVVAVFLLTLVGVGVPWIRWSEWLPLKSIGDSEVSLLFFLLSVYMLLGQHIGLLSSCFRSDGLYAKGILIGLYIRIAEFVVQSLAISMSQSFVLAVSALLFTRLAGYVCYGYAVRRMLPWIQMRWCLIDFSLLRPLYLPAASFMGFPLSNAISQQGVTMIAGSMFGSAAVVTLNTHRTVANIASQLMGIINTAVWPELTRAFGAGDYATARDLHRKSVQWSGWISLGGLVAICVLGPWLIPAWSLNRVVFEAPLMMVLLIGVAIRSLWYTSSVVAASLNLHARNAAVLSCATALSCVLMLVVSPHFGLTGLVACLVLVELVMAATVTPQSVRLTQDSFAGFFRFLLSPPFPKLLVRAFPSKSKPPR